MSQSVSVAEYIVARLAALGIKHAFGVPGDFSFPLNDAFESSKSIEWIGCSNELNAAYAADGYARTVGAAVLCTTFGVGELSALNGVMGSRAEHLPVFHVVGHPSQRLQRARTVSHHSLGDGDFSSFTPLSAAACCIAAELTPQNCVTELERAIEIAIRQSQPAYLYVAEDLALMPIAGSPIPFRTLDQLPRASSDSNELAAAAKRILGRIGQARRPIAFVSHRIRRHRLVSAAVAFLEKSGIPFVTTPMDKTSIDPQHPLSLGVYAGANSPPAVKEAVESSDCVLDLGGVVWSDFNTGMWSHKIDLKSVLQLHPHEVRHGDASFGPVWLGDLLDRITAESPRNQTDRPKAAEDTSSALPTGSSGDPITSKNFYPRFRQFLGNDDIIVCETGECVLRMGTMKLPHNSSYHNQTLWGSIGWSTPAAFGTSLAALDRRTVLITGDGSHQLTATEIGVMGRYGVRPVIFILNNGVYGIEEVLNKTPGHEYDNIAHWNYADIPAAMGCRDWFTVRVTTIGELDAALAAAADRGRAAYIEVVLAADAHQALPPQIIDNVYKTVPPV
jgi:indolepyruvate decarboxylase